MKPLTLLGISDDGDREYRCPMCGDIVTAYSNTFYGQCRACKLTVIDYKPLPHQAKFLESSAPYLLMVGGFGSGKTTTAIAKIAHHAMQIRKGRTLITGPKLQLINDAVIPELLKFLPPWFIERQTKTPMYFKLINGHEIVVYASNDEENLRSLNLTAFYIEEASNVDYSIFRQLQTRLRNGAAIKKQGKKVIYDKTMGIVCTNPDDGWVRDKFLLYSKNIYASKSVDTSYYDKLKQRKQYTQFESHLSSSRDNHYLPPQFITNMSIGKTREWINKYIDCKLDIREGAVYPEFNEHLVDDFPIPAHWLRVAGFDRGWTDPTTLLVGAVDPDTGIVYVYAEYGEANMPLSYHAMRVRDMLLGLKLLTPVQACPSVLQVSDQTGKSYQDLFSRATDGMIFLEPSTYAIETGIDMVHEYYYLNKLKVFKSCYMLKEEAAKYTYREATLTKDANDKPMDKYNHFMDSLRYLVMGLPNNPKDLIGRVQNIAYSGYFRVGQEKKEVGFGAVSPHQQKQNESPMSILMMRDDTVGSSKNIYKGGMNRGRR